MMLQNELYIILHQLFISNVIHHENIISKLYHGVSFQGFLYSVVQIF